MLNDPKFIRQGWECPKCGRVYSPDTSMCMYCGQKDQNTYSTTTTPVKGFASDNVTVVGTCDPLTYERGTWKPGD